MAAIADVIKGIIGGVADVGFSFYDRQKQNEINQRDFDYQKALQQQIFEREDNAVQRRMADLKAAGLNPNLAAGSAAGAGSVVGRSQTNYAGIGNPVGTILDTISAQQQIKTQNLQNQILNNQNQKAYYDALMAKSDYQADNLSNVADELQLMQMLGIDANTLSLRRKNGSWFIYNDWNGLEDGEYWLSQETPLSEMLLYQLQNNKNAAEMLQKDNQWYTADKLFGYAKSAAGTFSGIGSGYNSFRGSRRR